MRILCVDGGYFNAALADLGHDVLPLPPDPHGKVLSLKDMLALLERRAFQPDLVLWSDTCRTPRVIGLETLPAATIGYSIDQYCNPWHVPYSAAFDHMLLAQKDYLPLFALEHIGRPCEWFPLFCDPRNDKDLGLERAVPVSFVGTVRGGLNRAREPFLKAFRRRAPLVVRGGEYAPLFNQSRIVLNQSAAGELNFRIFQAMACGAAVLTEHAANGLAELFTPGGDILTYARNDPASAAAAANRALESPEALAALAKAGWENVLANHSTIVRAKRITALAERLLAERAPQRRAARLDAVRAEVALAYVFLATDAEIPLPDADRGFFLRLSEQESVARSSRTPSSRTSSSRTPS